MIREIYICYDYTADDLQDHRLRYVGIVNEWELRIYGVMAL